MPVSMIATVLFCAEVAVGLPGLRAPLERDGVGVRRPLRRDRVDLLDAGDALQSRHVRDLGVDRDAGQRRMRLVEHMRAARERRDHVALRRVDRGELILGGRAGRALTGVAERVVRHPGRFGLELEQEGVIALRGHALQAARQRAAGLGEGNVTCCHVHALRERPPLTVISRPCGCNGKNNGSRGCDRQQDESLHSPDLLSCLPRPRAMATPDGRAARIVDGSAGFG